MTHPTSHTHETIFVRLQHGDVLPDALTARLRESAVATGTLRAHGVLEHVELRTFVSHTRTLGTARAINGAVHLLAGFGTIGLSEGSPFVTLRVVLSRETDSGTETLSGIITSARVVALEVIVDSAQDLALPLVHDGRAGFALIDVAPGASATNAAGPSVVHAQPHAHHTAREESPKPPGAWADAVATSSAQPPLPMRPPQKPEKPYEETLIPDAGDQVEHFAFGRADVVRSDGDRLHLKVHKDGRIREIALEMLKVTLLDTDPETRPRHFSLTRKL